MNNNLYGYIGTYTNENSEGIYRIEFNENTGAIHQISLATKIENPTYLSINKSKNNLYSVTKEFDLNNNIYGGVTSFNINNDFTLTPINKLLIKGAPPCHVSLTSNDNFLFSSNYHDKHIDMYSLNEKGELVNSISNYHHGKSHIHYAIETPFENLICVLDLGLDKIFFYSIKNDNLILETHLTLVVKPNCGPRHMVFSPNKKYAYVLCECSNEVIILKCFKDTSFEIVDYISTLPNDFSGTNSTAAIRISSNGKYLYCSNRGHNSISVFKIASDGSIKLINCYSTYGNEPRDFNFSPNEKFLIIGNHKSNNLTVYKCLNDGQLTLISKDTYIPSPVCITFI